ncbi:hypothetical protein G647_01605 [Cladophialophora carrionii CBS 160.54]|uniref:6-phosphogluconate dehydrogenase NADP-binding domain-containing protein n=1 Tax=Cladophialophora carrionii CBS 160.54 TaxID=1279043 RepID=V9DT47_9EURO|nr:uncharacterized protein G647_01605 [Cladophialophora carrionii CBS 160.54]ETI29152.1 hypothetical protein G647_01605 [Cladophialophora carrionii CBS 160.54]
MATTSDNVTFGFIGLGNMGSMMAHNLATYAQSNGLPKIQIWNRTRAKAESLATNNHCEPAGSILELAQKCDIIHTCLANDEVALSICRELFPARKEGLMLVDHSTLFPTTSSTLNKEARRAGVSFMSCPVFGPPAAAKSAGLLIVLSGSERAREKVKSYIVPTLGKAVIDCGEDTSKGALLKILGNNCILGTIELLSESFTLAEKTGFDTNIFYDFIQQWFPAAAWVNYGKKIRDGTFSGKTGFTLPGGMKDAAYIRRLGAETATPTPIIDQAWNHLTTAKAIGGESLDWSACAAGMRVTAGLKPFKGEDFTLRTDQADGVNGAEP